MASFALMRMGKNGNLAYRPFVGLFRMVGGQGREGRVRPWSPRLVRWRDGVPATQPAWPKEVDFRQVTDAVCKARPACLNRVWRLPALPPEPKAPRVAPSCVDFGL